MPIRAVVYVSEAGPAISGDLATTGSEKLGWLVEDALRFNRDAGVTGVLLFDGARFLQYLEGPEDGLSVAYSRVLGASSHSGIVELQRGRVGQRRLPFWPMKWLPLESAELRRLAHADWTRFNQRRGVDEVGATAMEILSALVEPHTNAA